MRGTGALYFAAAHPCEPMLAAAKASERVRVAGPKGFGPLACGTVAGGLLTAVAVSWSKYTPAFGTGRMIREFQLSFFFHLN